MLIADKPFTKDNLDSYLKEMAKEFRRRNGSTVSAEYLVAMKLMAGRQYKNDFSDIAGILMEQEEQDNAFTLDQIKKAVADLYDSYDSLPENSRLFIESIYEKDSLEGLYKLCRQHEQENRDVLLAFQDDYPGILNGNNLEEVLKMAKEKKGKPDFSK